MGALKITWIVPDRIVREGSTPTAQRVDVRLRCVLPAAVLARRGHRVEAVAIPDLPQWEQNPHALASDVYIIGKTLWDVAPFVQRLRAAGGNAKIILDLCDNVFEPPEDSPKPYTQAILPMVDGIVTSTETLRDAIAPYMPRGISSVTIPDCVEGIRRQPHFAPAPDALKLLWFGYWNNLPHVHRLLPSLATLPIPIELTLVTAWDLQRRAGLQGNPSGIQTRFVEWSPMHMTAELARTDMVVIPSSQEPAFRTRSPNRIITALWAGRYVVAHRLPSYEPFAPFAGLGEELPALILEALRDPAGTAARIAAGQEHIAAHFGTESIADQWESFARRLIAGP